MLDSLGVTNGVVDFSLEEVDDAWISSMILFVGVGVGIGGVDEGEVGAETEVEDTDAGEDDRGGCCILSVPVADVVDVAPSAIFDSSFTSAPFMIALASSGEEELPASTPSAVVLSNLLLLLLLLFVERFRTVFTFNASVATG